MRQGYRSEHYKRNLHTTAGEVELKVPKLKGVPFETAIIERYRRREGQKEYETGESRQVRMVSACFPD